MFLDDCKETLRIPITTLDNETFQAMFNHAGIGILIADSKGVIRLVNEFIKNQFGYKEEELLGYKIEKLIPTRLRKKHEKYRSKFNDKPHNRPIGVGMELVGTKKDGSEFPVEVSLGHYTIENQHFALAFVSDITQRKETEQAIIQLNTHLEEKVKEGTQSLAFTVDQLSAQIKETEKKDAELHRVNTFLNNIWNHAGAIIIVADKNGLIQFFNPAAEKALGYCADEIVNKYPITLFNAADELQNRAVELSAKLGREIKPDFELLAALAGEGQGSELEWHYVRKGGSTFYVSLDIAPIKEDDKITGYLGIAIDISEKKIAEAELISALEKEKELNELKSRFVSMASHEFRTPLSAVLSSAYLLSRYTSVAEQPQRDKHIQRIVSSVSSLTEILNDFLSVGKIEEGNIYPQYNHYDVKKQIDEAIQEVQHLLKKGQKIRYTHAGNTVAVLDTSMMKHIIVNLLSNAIKFSPEDSIIEINTENGMDRLVFSILDHGIGIPKEDQENLFKRFFRSSNVTNIQGTGLGLHIVKKYTELMNGNIKCKSTEGKGTQFTITINKKAE